MASEPSETEIRGMYATALGMLHATQRQVDSLTAQLATAKREAVEAFVKVVLARPDVAYVPAFVDVLEDELARIREAK